MISLIMLGSIINYLTRSTLAVAAPTLLKELHISAQRIFVDHRRLSGRHHVTADLRVCAGCARPEDRVRHFRDRLVAGEYGAFLGRQLAGICLASRAAWVRRRIGQSGGHEGNGGMVSGQGAGTGGRRVQHRSLGGFHVSASAGRLGHSGLQLAGGVRHYRQPGVGLGGAVVVVLSIARQAPRPFGTKRRRTFRPARRSTCRAMARARRW